MTDFPALPAALLSAESSTTDHASGTLSELDKEVVRYIPPGGNWKNLPDNFPSKRVQQIRESAARGEGSRSTYYGRLQWNRPSYTISTYITRPGNGCFIHPSEARLLTLREAARLQTFPDTWRFAGTMRHRAIQIGNAVPPLLGYSVASMFDAGVAVDLFSGSGGLSLGALLAGHDLVAAVDNEPAAVDSHNQNMPGESAFVGDLSQGKGLDRIWAEIRRRTEGRPELLLGGPPCQGFSTAGKSLADDPRNRLLWSFVEAVEALGPRHVVMENVLALAQSRGRDQLDQVRTALFNLGYHSDVKILHAEAYGVPQRRRRMVLVASLETLPQWKHPTHQIDSPSFLKLQPGGPGVGSINTVQDAIGDLNVAEGATLDSNVRPKMATSTLQRWLQGQPVESEKVA